MLTARCCLQVRRWKRTRRGGRCCATSFNDYTLAEPELLLMSDRSENSFDGRYFGPVHLSRVKGVLRPVITF